MVGIYKITNPNGRIYIGQSINIERRWISYKKLNCKDQPSLYSSLKKYGFKNHKFEVIEECLIEELDNKEIEWGKFYDVLSNKHLNNRLGKGRGTVSEETKKLMSKNSRGISRGKGMKFTEQHKQNISKSKTGCKYPNFKTRKDKGISKNNHIEAVIKSKIKPIIQLDLEGNFIKEWESGKEASRVLNINQANINIICNGKGKTYKGFIWKFKI
jgi:group I intron endonuclease